MRFLAYADIHFAHNWVEFNPTESNGRSRWLNITIDVWKQIDRLAQEYQVDGKLFAGDLSHKRSFIHTTVNNSILELYKKAKIPEYKRYTTAMRLQCDSPCSKLKEYKNKPIAPAPICHVVN